MISIVVEFSCKTGVLTHLWPCAMQGCGCCRANLRAAGGSAVPSFPSPIQVILLTLRVFTAPSLLPCVSSYSCRRRDVRECVCVGARVCMLVTTNHCFLSAQFTCVCVLVFPASAAKSNLTEAAPGLWSTCLNVGDPLTGSAFTLSLTE